MGGRGTRGGPGPGTGAKNKKGAGAGTSSGAAGGSGSSAGSSGGGGKGTGSAGTGGVTGGGGSGSGGGSGGGSTINQQQTTELKIEYGDGLTDVEKAKQQSMLDKLPEHLNKRLHETGTKLWVGTRADKTPGWAEHAKDTGVTSTTKIGDGREVGELSFYYPARNEIFISVHNPGGSVNVYVHELAHAIDYQHTGKTIGVEFPPDSGNLYSVRIISDDPYWKKLHADHIVNNTNINSYYRGGPTGKDERSGRRELFAEGFAIYNERGIIGLRGFVGSREVADMMVEVWKRYGVVK
ncbi:peptidase [Mycobacterium phage Adzzy]|uniref:peptidase n=1 Tax=Mycobacterium phage Adzzy TaxID=1383059 RepID=UPI000387FBB1|nr:peptidase [Mycobacterium phage Adzzy]AGT14255.1 hypothetical protein ADZZY_2 [Mycobacterium phage Adzzy]